MSMKRSGKKRKDVILNGSCFDSWFDSGHTKPNHHHDYFSITAFPEVFYFIPLLSHQSASESYMNVVINDTSKLFNCLQLHIMLHHLCYSRYKQLLPHSHKKNGILNFQFLCKITYKSSVLNTLPFQKKQKQKAETQLSTSPPVIKF